MEDRRFDEIVGLLASDSSRRLILRGIGVSAVGAALSLLRPSTGQSKPKEEKVGVCHRTHSKKKPFVFIEVSRKAALKHQKQHGDAIDVDLATDVLNCGKCGVSCDDGNACTTDTCVDGACVHTPIARLRRGPHAFTPVAGRAGAGGNSGTEQAAPTPPVGAACVDRLDDGGRTSDDPCHGRRREPPR